MLKSYDMKHTQEKKFIRIGGRGIPRIPDVLLGCEYVLKREWTS